MSTVTITINATQQEFSTFADELGYMSEVTTMVDAMPVTGPNPLSKQQFIEAYFKEIVVAELSSRKLSAVDRIVRMEKEAEKAVLVEGIRTAVSVTSKV